MIRPGAGAEVHPNLAQESRFSSGEESAGDAGGGDVEVLQVGEGGEEGGSVVVPQAGAAAEVQPAELGGGGGRGGEKGPGNRCVAEILERQHKVFSYFRVNLNCCYQESERLCEWRF